MPWSCSPNQQIEGVPSEYMKSPGPKPDPGSETFLNRAQNIKVCNHEQDSSNDVGLAVGGQRSGSVSLVLIKTAPGLPTPYPGSNSYFLAHEWRRQALGDVICWAGLPLSNPDKADTERDTSECWNGIGLCRNCRAMAVGWAAAFDMPVIMGDKDSGIVVCAGRQLQNSELVGFDPDKGTALHFLQPEISTRQKSGIFLPH